jgi:hypothetical protein
VVGLHCALAKTDFLTPDRIKLFDRRSEMSGRRFCLCWRMEPLLKARHAGIFIEQKKGARLFGVQGLKGCFAQAKVEPLAPGAKRAQAVGLDMGANFFERFAPA